LYELGTPTLSLRDYANAMIIESDNTATNVLIERLGMVAITGRMEGLGLGSIRLRRYMIDIEAAKKGLENVATPADLAKLLRVFHNAVGLTPASARRFASSRNAATHRSGARCPPTWRSRERTGPWRGSAPTRRLSTRRTGRS
jgi:beta-lactamase class A